MRDNSTFYFVYVESKSARTILIKKSREFDFTFQLNGIETRKFESVDQVSAKSDDPDLILPAAKITTLILFKTNIEMHRNEINGRFAEQTLAEIAKDNTSTAEDQTRVLELLREEKRALLNILDTTFVRIQREIDSLKSADAVESYYTKTRSTMVLGSYVAVNKVDEVGS